MGVVVALSYVDGKYQVQSMITSDSGLFSDASEGFWVEEDCDWRPPVDGVEEDAVELAWRKVAEKARF